MKTTKYKYDFNCFVWLVKYVGVNPFFSMTDEACPKTVHSFLTIYTVVITKKKESI